MHALSEVIDDCVGDGAREVVVPCGGTGFKIVARRVGAPAVSGTERNLSTGDLVHGPGMDHVLPLLRGAR
uniref:hypothetical protein n=1 Tax=Streptomyces sp. FR1 TaxID=349971 RepID=UPI0015E84D45|nr:hypothetical protein [Streptomyces sp. FR1]